MKLRLAGATAVALGLLTAGCSSGSGTKAAAPSTGTSQAAGSAAVSSSSAQTAGTPTTAAPAAASTATGSRATSAAAGGKATPVAVCTALPTSQVASLSGVAVTSSREQDFAAANDYTCDYDTAAGSGGLSVTVALVDGAAEYATSMKTDLASQAVEHVTPVSGLGDKAFSARDGVRALFGDQMIYVAGLTTVPPAEAIIKALQAKLT